MTVAASRKDIAAPEIPHGAKPEVRAVAPGPAPDKLRTVLRQAVKATA